MAKVHQSVVDICILIPCYNNLEGLIRSVSSIVYPPERFVVLVVDDGSSIPVTRSALYEQVSLAVDIQIVRLRQNQGITKALNSGLDFVYANYPVHYIARLDCGDICHAERFTRQVAFFGNNPGIDLLGSWCYFKDCMAGSGYEYITPTSHESIERSMYFRNVFIHPTIMWRAASMKASRYPENFPHAEDYGLFYDIILKKKAAILNEFLVVCEINRNGISFLNRAAQLKSRLRIVIHYGENKLLVAAGAIKLILLMTLPHRLINRMKTKVLSYTPHDNIRF